MSQHLTPAENRLPPYPCNQIVFRAVIHENWVKNGRVKHHAFTRYDKDVDGLSVGPTREACADGLSRPIFGALTLHVGRVRAVGLDVIPDAPNHANIVGVPFRDEDEKEHGRLTRLLAAQSRPVP